MTNVTGIPTPWILIIKVKERENLNWGLQNLIHPKPSQLHQGQQQGGQRLRFPAERLRTSCPPVTARYYLYKLSDILNCCLSEELLGAGRQSGHPQSRGDEGLHPLLHDAVIRLRHLPAQRHLLWGPWLRCRQNRHWGIRLSGSFKVSKVSTELK